MNGVSQGFPSQSFHINCFARLSPPPLGKWSKRLREALHYISKNDRRSQIQKTETSETFRKRNVQTGKNPSNQIKIWNLVSACVCG